MTPEQLASLAQSLKDNEVFQEALKNIRTGALEDLAVMKRSDEQAFYDAQATVRVIDGLTGNLEQFIRSGAPKKPVGLP